MLSTSSKIAFGYLILICLLFTATGYIYQQMTILTSTNETEAIMEQRRKTTHQIVSQLYQAEVIGQTLRTGNLQEYDTYKNAMQVVSNSVDSLQLLLTDTIQLARLDTIRTLLRDKERNMLLVLEGLRTQPADELFQMQIDSLIAQQDSVLNSLRVRKKVVTHHNSYTVYHKPKGFFKRLANVFSPDKSDSTQVSNVVQEIYSDTIEEPYNAADTLAGIINNIQQRVSQTRQEHQQVLSRRLTRLRIAGGKLGTRVNQLLETIETDEQKAMQDELQKEKTIREQAARTMAIIAILAILLILIFFIIIWKDLTRSNHYRRELEKAKSYAENLLETREKLMLTITHDIKAPTGSIIGYIDLLMRLIRDKRQLFYLNNMKSSAQHLLKLVTSLLDYHRLEAGKMDLNPIAFNPYELFEDIYTGFLPLAEKKDLELTLENNLRRKQLLEGDPFRIRQIAENLLSNALKFTTRGNITIQTRYREGVLTFSVSDTGCGMTEEEQSHIFQEFTRLRSAQGKEGFGLGLSITRKLTELLKGNINVESSPGEGSTFRISIPLPPANMRPVNENIETIQAQEPLRILLIDDDRIQLNLTEAMLRSLPNGKSLTIRSCERPEELFELLRTEPFDLLFTDIQMPGMNGFDLLQALRHAGIPQARTIPVIAITARNDLNENDFIQKKFAGCLYKPFNQSDLQRILKGKYRNVSSECPQQAEEKNETLPGKDAYDFSQLTAFSGDDITAAKEIIETFIQETEKNLQRFEQAFREKNMHDLSAVSHKMLPTFTMIKAQNIIPLLRKLESLKEETEISADTADIIPKIIAGIREAIQQAKNLKIFSSKS